MFANQSGENRGAFVYDNLKQFAVELGLDAAAFNECIDSGRHNSTVQGETNSGRQIGVQSTPTFLVNGQPVIGAQPFEVFQQAIEAELAKAGP